MVHKKYIKRNGKVYGPYYYKSKRVGDKVVSEYVGEKEVKKVTKRKTIIVGAFLVVVLFLLLLISINSGIFSGKAVDNLENQNVVQNVNTLPQNTSNAGELNIGSKNFEGVSQSVRNFKNWIIVTFKKGDEVEEYSYSNTLSKAELESLIERDKALFLQKISN